MQIVKFLDVGHGDCTAIYFMESDVITATAVIDLPNSTKLLEELNSQNIRKVNCIVISHSDIDHCRELTDFLKKYLQYGTVGKIVFCLDRRNVTDSFEIMLERILELTENYDIELGSGVTDTGQSSKRLLKKDGTELCTIYPNMKDAISPYLEDNTNNASIVCQLDNGAVSVLFPGDLEAEGWENLLARKTNLTCSVLKMPHHGAYWQEECSVDSFLEKLKPEAVVISTRNHRHYNHPRKETIDALNGRDIRIYCTEYTDLCGQVDGGDNKCCGDITLTIQNREYSFTTENKCIAAGVGHPAGKNCGPEAGA